MRHWWTSSIACRPMKKVMISRRSPVTLGLVAAALALAGCAQSPKGNMARSKEYFPESVYGKASPRVVADGEDVPRGGGRYHVGQPYTIAGKTYYPSERKIVATGTASWYGSAFHGRRTANGEIFDRNSISAAHPTMPLPSYARVTNLRNNHSIIVRVNDRGPYHGGRVMDVSQRVADALDFKRFGTARIRVEQIGKANLAGSDDRKLLASLRTDGTPAQFDGYRGGAGTMVAEAPEPQRVASLRTEPARAAAPIENDDAPASPTPPSRAASAPMTFEGGHAPSPPPRPFDLGTIPGAGVPIAATRAKTASR